MNNDEHSQEAKSEITEAVEKADAGQIKNNFNQDKAVDKPKPLSEAEETPFIDEKIRTDK